jgi:hypothetical protein
LEVGDPTLGPFAHDFVSPPVLGEYSGPDRDRQDPRFVNSPSTPINHASHFICEWDGCFVPRRRLRTANVPAFAPGLFGDCMFEQSVMLYNFFVTVVFSMRFL